MAAWSVCALLFAACGDSADSASGDGGATGGDSAGGGDGAGCTSLCTGSGFASGSQMNFGGGVIECVCSGAGKAIAQADCGAYCADFDVAADKSYLSMQTVQGDKCVCDGTQPGGGTSGGDNGSTTGGTTGGGTTGGDSSGAMLDANGFPSLPDPALPNTTGVIVASVTNSKSTHLANGIYTSPHSKSASTASGVSFIPGGLAIVNMPSMQLNLTWSPMQMSGTFKCDGATDIILRYGMPPSGNQQLLTLSCSMDFTYDAGSKTYAGTITAQMGDGLTEPSAAMTADVKARFSFLAE